MWSDELGSEETDGRIMAMDVDRGRDVEPSRGGDILLRQEPEPSLAHGRER